MDRSALANDATSRQCCDCELPPEQLEHKGDTQEYAHRLWKGDVAVSAAVKGNKAVPQKACPKKASAKGPKKSATKKQAVIREPKKVENLLAGGEVCRKFTMTVQVSGYEYLADPVAATRRVLILALTKIPPKIHEEQVDNGSISKGLFNKRAEIHFNGVLNDPKNPTGADLHSPNMWQWQPAER
jgi:hypothetical protein